jgi:hypothetical protein
LKGKQGAADKSNSNFANKINFPGGNVEALAFECDVYPQTQYL